MPRYNFAINRSCAPRMSLNGFIGLAQVAGAGAVEIRNDIAGQEFANGMPAGELARRLGDAGLGVASINALQRFNDWTPERETEARELAAYAMRLGADGIVLCPVIDEAAGWSRVEAERKLREALRSMAPIFRDTGVTGLVEPLGMRGSTMTRQLTAVEAISDVGGWDAFRLCHDTFQFYRCGDSRMFPEHFGMCHISGIPDSGKPRQDLTDAERGLVFLDDRVGNLAQLRHILRSGYRGPISMEIFDPEVCNDPAISARLVASFDYLRASLQLEAA